MRHTLKVYKGTKLHGEYMTARFDKANTGKSFPLDGHRWAYEVSAFDDDGDYDLLYRFDDKPYPEEESNSVDELTARDYFASAYMQGVSANPERLYRVADLAKEAYEMADAMLAARAISKATGE